MIGVLLMASTGYDLEWTLAKNRAFRISGDEGFLDPTPFSILLLLLFFFFHRTNGGDSNP